MQLFRFAWFRDIEQSLEELADLAMDEQWDYKHTESIMTTSLMRTLSASLKI